MQAEGGIINDLIDFFLRQTGDRLVQDCHQQWIEIDAGDETGLQRREFQRVIVLQIADPRFPAVIIQRIGIADRRVSVMIGDRKQTLIERISVEDLTGWHLI